MTVLGDLAQATRPGAQSSWVDALAHLGDPEGAQLTELELGYRVPAPVIDYANRLLPEAAPDVRPSRSVRASGREPVIVAVGDPSALAAEVAAVIAERASAWRTVGLVVPEAIDTEVRATLPSPLPDTVLVVNPPEAKGLEFDAVVVVEPSLFAAGGPAGLRLLYIALTRAVQELTVVHAAPLPPALVLASTSPHLRAD